MILLDENYPQEQAVLLRKMGVKARHFGHDWGASGTDDAGIFPLLHRRRGVTFFTRDSDFRHRGLSHPAYALVCLDVRPDDFASFTRRFLRHPMFDTVAKRMGLVAELHYRRILVWKRAFSSRMTVSWES